MTNYYDTPEGETECPNCLGSCYEIEPITLCNECESDRTKCKQCKSKNLHIVDHGKWCTTCGGEGLVTESQARDYRNERYADHNLECLREAFAGQLNGFKH